MFNHLSIDTLPIWEAQKETDGCIFCLLRNRLEDQYLDHYMGDAKMESDIRIEVNEKGFCPRHFKIMLEQKEGKLGLGLMVHTHLMERNRQIEKLLRHDGPHTEKQEKLQKSDYTKLKETLVKEVHTCAVCDKIAAHMEVYYKTFTYMMEHDKDFKAAVEQGKGFCLEHFGCLVDSASKTILMLPKRKEILRLLTDLELKQLEKDINDIEWFTRKFDYRNADKPWGDSRDALPRCIERLEGKVLFPADYEKAK